MTGVRLVGRDGETDMIAGLLEGIRDRGGALVVAGGLAQAENLPLPQRNTIQAAFAMAVAAAPDLFLIASKPTVNEAVT
jgi:hypothetical protein